MSGHLAVHQDQIVLALFQRFHGFASVHHRVGGQAQLLQQAQRDALIDLVVFGQQNPLELCSGRGLFGWRCGRAVRCGSDCAAIAATA